MAGRISTSTPPTTNIVAADRTTADQAALQPQQQVVLPQTVPPVEQPRPIRRTVVTGVITSVTINDEPATAEGTNEVALQLPTSQSSISVANTSHPIQPLGPNTCNSQITPTSPNQTAAAQAELAPLLPLPARTQDRKSKPLGDMPQGGEWWSYPGSQPKKGGPHDTRATEPLGAPPRGAHPRCNPATVQPNGPEHPEYGLLVEPPRRRMINLPQRVLDNAPELPEWTRSTGAQEPQTGRR
uniref:Uncharacterized protein n=1 Tax=Glossina pallidipes TaxID=7398 RepID=A0A1B0ACY9_GLOPL